VAVDRDTTYAGPYATAARLYRAAGWLGVLPVGSGPGEKWPPPRAYTGHGAPDPSGADIEAYCETHGDRNLALRAPVGVLGLDVDAYEKAGKSKGGGEALAALIEAYGPLPHTWVSGARPAPSGIYWYRVPELLDGAPINWPGEAAKGIEIIQRGHRYGLVWPSTNPEADGAEYGWRWPLAAEHRVEGHPIPRPADLAELPEAWVRGLALSYARTEKSDLAGNDMAAWWEMLRPDPACPRVTDALTRARHEIALGQAGRHETARDSARLLAAYGGEGHAGAAEALTQLGAVFVAAISGPGRDAEAEWHRLLVGAVELAATDNPAPRQLCACSPPSLVIPLPPGVPPFASPPSTTLPGPASSGLPSGETITQLGPVPLPDAPPESDALTDARLTQLVHDELLDGRYCWSQGFGWLLWDGRRWRECSDETVIEDVRQWAVRFVEQQVANVYIAASREMRNLLIGLLSKYRLTAIVALARGLCQVDPAAFDGHPDLLNTPSGIVDLRTGELLPHDPAMRMTKITGVAYDPAAGHPDWPAALRAVRPDVATWLRLRFGQSITGHMTPDDVLLILRGGGENGKSTILNAIKQALGDYGIFVSDRVLLSDPGSHPTELMDFRGARFTLTEELPDEARLNVKRLKDVVGTPTMKARRMRQDPVEFAATHSLFISTNPLPLVTDTDHGTWRRLALVEFPYRFTKPGQPVDESRGERKGDAGLRDRLRDGVAQREAVLLWLVQGAVEWYAAGKAMPQHPESVLRDTQEWRAKSDPIEGFWHERLRPAAEAFITSSDMTAAFNDYLSAIRQHEWSDRRFVPLFGDHSTTRRHGVEYRQERVKAHHVRSYRLTPGAMSVTVPSPFVPEPTAVGAKVRAWWGVRFATQTDLDQD
jgi:putative DNA primase/helicase